MHGSEVDSEPAKQVSDFVTRELAMPTQLEIVGSCRIFPVGFCRNLDARHGLPMQGKTTAAVIREMMHGHTSRSTFQI